MADEHDEWQPVCRMSDLEVERGATALVHGHAVALFRTLQGEVFALGNHDPFAPASALAKGPAKGPAKGLARGIVGVRGDVPFVASPVHQHAFDLRTGRCLDDVHVAVPAYAVRVRDGVVLVGARLSPESTQGTG